MGGVGEGGVGVGGFRERRKRRENTLDFSFSQQIPSLLHNPPPTPTPPPPPRCQTSAKCPSSTITAQQHDTTTNSASLTSHGKHSCMSVLFARRPFHSRHFVQDLKCVLQQAHCYGRGPLCPFSQTVQTVCTIVFCCDPATL